MCVTTCKYRSRLKLVDSVDGRIGWKEREKWKERQTITINNNNINNTADFCKKTTSAVAAAVAVAAPILTTNKHTFTLHSQLNLQVSEQTTKTHYSNWSASVYLLFLVSLFFQIRAKIVCCMHVCVEHSIEFAAIILNNKITNNWSAMEYIQYYTKIVTKFHISV